MSACWMLYANFLPSICRRRTSGVMNHVAFLGPGVSSCKQEITSDAVFETIETHGFFSLPPATSSANCQTMYIYLKQDLEIVLQLCACHRFGQRHLRLNLFGEE